MTVKEILQEFEPISTKELILLKKVLIFSRVLAENKTSGRAEIHFEHGRELRLHKYEVERLQ